jgi:hypothetical protein
MTRISSIPRPNARGVRMPLRFLPALGKLLWPLSLLPANWMDGGDIPDVAATSRLLQPSPMLGSALFAYAHRRPRGALCLEKKTY